MAVSLMLAGVFSLSLSWLLVAVFVLAAALRRDRSRAVQESKR